MITYQNTITVYLERKKIGTIMENTGGGVFYLPTGYRRDESTKIYDTVAQCKAALEAD